MGPLGLPLLAGAVVPGGGGDHVGVTTLQNVADGDPLGATLLSGAGFVLGRGGGQVGEITLQDMTDSGVCRLRGGDPLGAPVLGGTLVLDRGGGHDGETKLTFTGEILGT